MKKSILCVSLCVFACYAFGQCGPYAITATDSSCTSYVLSVSGASAAGQIVWDLNGMLDTVYRGPAGVTVAGGNGRGSAANQLFNSNCVYLDRSGNIYVADKSNDRIQEFPAGSTSATNGMTVAGGNGFNNSGAPNQIGPTGVYIDTSGNIYVADGGFERIEEFPAGSTSATNGTAVAGQNGYGTAADQILPMGVYLDSSGNIYVADLYNYRIQRFPAGSTSATNGTTVAGGNGQGSGPNQFTPTGLYVDGAGNVYIADAGNNRIQKFPVGSTSATNGTTIAGGNGPGNAPDQLNSPRGVYVDSSGNIYVADYNNNRIQKFPSGSTSATNAVTVAGGNGSGASSHQFDGPASVYVDASGNIYVDDENNNRIQKWSQPALTAIDTSVLVPSAGIYSVIIITSGCATAYDTLSITSDLSSSISEHICQGSTYSFGGYNLSAPGSYFDTLTSMHGCDSIITLSLTVDSFTAYFTLQPSPMPHLWYIVNQCTGNSLTYVWNWGDSTATSTGDTPSHTYADTGYYNVCVTVTDSMGCTASYCDTNVYLFKDQSGQMVYIEVLPQYPAGINTITTASLKINYYAGSVHFSDALQTPTQLRLYDLSGRVVMAQDDFSGNVWKINDGLADGVYGIHLQNAQFSISLKLMILH